MLEFFNSFGFSTADWVISMVCGLLIGMAKAGVSGTGMAIIPIMAMVFGGKPSTGIVLPMLITADVFAVRYYNRHAEWKYVLKVMPWAMIGVFIALAVGHYISDSVFKSILSVSVLLGVGLMIWQDIRKSLIVPEGRWFAAVLGLAGGFATMIGNAAGPIMALYLLSMRIPKFVFIGTGAWFFLLINLFKVPLHIFVWKTITLKTLTFNAILAPAIITGVFIGIQIVKIIPEKPYRFLVIGTTVVSSLLLF
ncbi:MAG: sulfite exporter TauE/SafE family protein [Proteobacteria bacterium]|nr:sulfite exporter TauE/SafE family protein [Pseudomonadota bacterium]